MPDPNSTQNVNPANVGPVVAPFVAPTPPPPNDASTMTRAVFPTTSPASPDAINLWNDRSATLPTRGRLLPVAQPGVQGKIGVQGSQGNQGTPGNQTVGVGLPTYASDTAAGTAGLKKGALYQDGATPCSHVCVKQ